MQTWFHNIHIEDIKHSIENLKQYLVFLVMSNYNVINTINVIKNLVLFHFFREL